MNWSDWFIIGWLSGGALLVVGTIGKPRKPTTPSTAVTVLVVDAVLVGLILWGHGVLS